MWACVCVCALSEWDVWQVSFIGSQQLIWIFTRTLIPERICAAKILDQIVAPVSPVHKCVCSMIYRSCSRRDVKWQFLVIFDLHAVVHWVSLTKDPWILFTLLLITLPGINFIRNLLLRKREERGQTWFSTFHNNNFIIYHLIINFKLLFLGRKGLDGADLLYLFLNFHVSC